MMIAARESFAAARRRGPTARDYVQDGLVAMWDGIENAGWGTHDASATVWKDLSGNGYHAEQRLPSGIGTEWEWTDNAYVGLKQNGHGFVVPDSLSSYLQPMLNSITLEGVFCPTITNKRMDIFSQFNHGAGVDGGFTFECTANGMLRVYYNAAPDINVDAWNVIGDTVLGFATTSDNTQTTVYLRGLLVDTYAKASGVIGNNSFVLGGEISRMYYSSLGNLSAIRIYSRALTADEIAANYAIDKERFNLP